jgi:hypothetical protein
MDMHQVEILRQQRIGSARQGAPAHAPVLGIFGHRGGGDAQHVTLCDRRGGGGGVSAARSAVPRCTWL